MECLGDGTQRTHNNGQGFTFREFMFLNPDLLQHHPDEEGLTYPIGAAYHDETMRVDVLQELFIKPLNLVEFILPSNHVEAFGYDTFNLLCVVHVEQDQRI